MPASNAIACAVCKKEFHVHDYRLHDKPRYCSWECSGVGRRKPVVSECLACSKPIKSTPSRIRKFCSLACRGKIWRGKGSPRFKGSRFRTVAGYIEITHPETGSRVREHRYLMEKFLGRTLLPSEDVHHKNGIKDDNRLENLQLLDHGEHSTLSNQIGGAWSRKHSCCTVCGQTDSPHSSRGRCRRCNQRLKARAKFGHKPRKFKSRESN
jgi:hypothetical protein